jgi:hypothetical protein
LRENLRNPCRPFAKVLAHIPLAKSAFVFENGNYNHGSDFAAYFAKATKAKKASSFATSFAEASSYAKASADQTADQTAVKKATADQTTDRWHGVHRVKMR